MDVIIDNLIMFCKFFRFLVEQINKDISNKKNIISFKNILYCCISMNGNSWSYSLANINMSMATIIDVSDCALKKKRNLINYIYFKTISDEILNFIYKDNDSPRIIGVDGTYIPLSIELNKYGF